MYLTFYQTRLLSSPLQTIKALLAGKQRFFRHPVGGPYASGHNRFCRAYGGTTKTSPALVRLNISTRLDGSLFAFFYNLGVTHFDGVELTYMYAPVFARCLVLAGNTLVLIYGYLPAALGPAPSGAILTMLADVRCPVVAAAVAAEAQHKKV